MKKKRHRRVYVHDLLGRKVRTVSGEIAGRIEEVRAEARGDHYEITEYLLGPGALEERLSIARLRWRDSDRTVVARWDQIDISRPDAPRLTCSTDALKIERPRD